MNRLSSFQSHFFLLSVLIFLLSCDENDPKPTPDATLADFISGTWEAVSVTYSEIERPEWEGFSLNVEKQTDTAGVFHAGNLPNYEEVPAEALDKYWPKTSSWVIRGESAYKYLVRSDGLDIAVDTVSENRMWLSFLIETAFECDMEEEEGCPLGFEGDWRFEMERKE